MFFRTKTICLDGWIDEEDDEIMTSCVLEKISSKIVGNSTNKLNLKGSHRVAFNCLLKLYESSGCNKTIGVDIQDWRNATYKAGISPTGKPEAKQKAFVRAVEKLRDLDLIEVVNNFYMPCRTPDTDRTFNEHVQD